MNTTINQTGAEYQPGLNISIDNNYLNHNSAIGASHNASSFAELSDRAQILIAAHEEIVSESGLSSPHLKDSGVNLGSNENCYF